MDLQTSNELFKARYAVKKFNADQSLSDEQVKILKNAMRMSPTSYGMQPFEVIEITDSKIKADLKPASWNQSQITDASHLYVFCAYNEFNRDYVANFVSKAADTYGFGKDEAEGRTDFMWGVFKDLTQEQRAEWARKQAYLVLGFTLATAAAGHIDTCPMEGFDPKKYSEYLKLNDKNLTPLAVLAAGVKSDEDKMNGAPKVRREENDLITTL